MDKPVPLPTGTGLLGLGYGLPRKTPGLPVMIPIDDAEIGEFTYEKVTIMLV
jgi:hypothetical protein